MEQAIKKAIEGGYKWNYTDRGHEVFYGEMNESVKLVCNAFHLLDPDFWKCLGKALGWKEEVCMYDGGIFNGHKDADTPNGPGEWWSNCENCGIEQLDKNEFPEGNCVPEYKYRWHTFIDHLAEGKDADSFFKELLR